MAEEGPKRSVRILPPTAEAPDSIRKYAHGVVAEIRKDYEKRKLDVNQTTLLRDGVDSDVKEWISTGLPELDYAIGGGWPVGRISEVFGPEETGKTALVHLGIKSVQLQGGFAEIFDFERSTDESKMRQQNIDPDRLIYHRPDCIEDAQDILSSSLKKYIKKPPKCPIFIAFDSVAAMPTLVEMETSASDPNVAAQARAMRRMLRNVALRLARARVHLLFVNQETDNIGGYTPNKMMKPKTTPGGSGLKYWSSLRLRTSKGGIPFKDGDATTGFLLKIETRKCKLNPPRRQIPWVLDFQYGPSTELTLFQTLLEARVIKGSNPQYTVPFLTRPFSRYGWIEILRTDMTARQKAAEVAVDIIASNVLPGPPPDDE